MIWSVWIHEWLCKRVKKEKELDYRDLWDKEIRINSELCKKICHYEKIIKMFKTD